MQYWLVKQEPSSYPWTRFVQDGSTAWTGVRNFQARNYLRAMQKGDQVFYYHSVVGKEIVGLAEVTREAYPDPTATAGDWSCVDLRPLMTFPNPVSLEVIKATPELANLPLLRQSRLSVMPVTTDEAAVLLALGGCPSKKS
jgi:predicted RNA-binding protein with PUA-like domain